MSSSKTDFRTSRARSNYLSAVLLTLLAFASVSRTYAEEEETATGSPTNPATNTNATHQSCLASLDATVAIASNESDTSDFLLQRFAQLEQDCSHLPQLAHNQGVVAGKAGRWPEAIAHFERSLKLDSRAAMTHRHLQQIFEHRAAQAYANALNIDSTASLPELYFQQSTNQNATAVAATSHRSELHSIGTIEYELYAWWQALQNSIGLKEHYIDDFPAAAIQLSKTKFSQQEWSDMHREIAFTANDAVAVVSDPFHNRTLLLLRLIGNRWKIYQETTL